MMRKMCKYGFSVCVVWVNLEIWEKCGEYLVSVWPETAFLEVKTEQLISASFG